MAWHSKDGRGVQRVMKLLCERRCTRDVCLNKVLDWVLEGKACVGAVMKECVLTLIMRTIQLNILPVLCGEHDTKSHNTTQHNTTQPNLTFNRVLNTFIDISFMQNASEPLKDGMQPLGGEFF